jgi:hypothetical protein
MKRLALCVVTIARGEHMRGRVKSEEMLKQVWVDDERGESARYVVERHYEALSDPYGTSFDVVSVDEVETIGTPE